MASYSCCVYLCDMGCSAHDPPRTRVHLEVYSFPELDPPHPDIFGFIEANGRRPRACIYSQDTLVWWLNCELPQFDSEGETKHGVQSKLYRPTWSKSSSRPRN